MSSYVNFTILKSSCNYLYDKITSEEERDQILEPFTVLVKLAYYHSNLKKANYQLLRIKYTYSHLINGKVLLDI